MPLTDRPAAALPPSDHLTGTASGRDPAVLKRRRGGTDEFLGRGAYPRRRAAGNGGPADPWKRVWCSRARTPLAEPVRRSRVRVGSKVVPVVTPGEEAIIAHVHRPYLDRRGHKRVRPGNLERPPCLDTVGSEHSPVSRRADSLAPDRGEALLGPSDHLSFSLLDGMSHSRMVLSRLADARSF